MDDECKASPTVCGVIDIWEVLGKRWSLLIIKNLRTKETIRFNELKRALSGISSTVQKFDHGYDASVTSPKSSKLTAAHATAARSSERSTSGTTT